MVPAGQHVICNTEFNGVPTNPFYVFTAKFIDITEDGIANSMGCTEDGIAYNFLHSSGVTSSAPLEGQIFRGLLQSAAGLEHCLRRLPPRVFEEFYLRHSEGRSAQEEGNWKRGILSFLECRTLLIDKEVDVEKEAYKWLLAWVDLSLAHLYQLQGSVESMSNSDRCDMLEQALKIRMEILDSVMPFANLHPQLVRVCKSYCYTAQYEWGSMKSSEAKMEAIQEYAKLVDCDKYEAEPQLCLLLYVDHYYAGSFEVSLLWIQEANRLWKELNSQDWRGYPPYCLECEAELLIKLEKFPEAVEALEDLPYTKDYTHEKHPKFAVKVYDWLQECYMQMSRRASDNGNAEMADRYEKSAQHAVKPSLSSDDNQEIVFDFVFTGIPPSHPILMQTPFPLGSWLGLVIANDNVADLYLKKLPSPIEGFIRYLCKGAQAAQEHGNWAEAISEYRMAREFLKFTEKIVDQETHVWLLAWVDLPLANLYHYRARKFGNALEIWEELVNCEVRLFPSDLFSKVSRNFKYAVHFEKSYTPDGKHECDDNSAHHNCFWLYFGYYSHGLFDASLKWIREAKRVDEQNFPERTCSIDFPFFCCEYDYLRCEADLLMKLKKFEEAGSTLEKLLKTRHVLVGSPRLAREARQWLKNCYVQVRRCSASADDEEIADLLRALELSEPTVDNYQQEGIADQPPSPTGCIFVTNIQDLVQSKAGLEQNLLKLPVPIHLAFRNFSRIGLHQQRYGGWDIAISEFESCRDLLKFSRTEIEKTCHDWLLVWADLPLAQLYEFKKMHFKKALDIWREMFNLTLEVILPDENVLTNGMMPIIFGFWAAAYQCVVHDYPDLRVLVVENIIQRSSNVRAGEVDLLAFLQKRYFNWGNFEVSLHWAREGKRLLKEILPGNENDRKKLETQLINLEALCLIKLGRFEDVKTIADEYWEVCDDIVIKYVDVLRETGFKKPVSPESCINTEEALMETLNRPPYLKQTLGSFSLQEVKKFEEALMVYDTTLERIDKHHNDSRGLDTTFYGEFGFYNSLRLGKLKKEEYFLCMDTYCRGISDSGAELKAPRKDANFSRAKQYFENCIDLSLPLREPNKIALMNYHLSVLYAHFEHAYARYFVHHLSRARTIVSEAVRRGIRLSDADPSMPQTLIDLANEIAEYLRLTGIVSSEMYARGASVVYASFLYTRKRYTENFVDELESHKELYAHLQCYYCSRAGLYGYLASLTGAHEEMQTCRWRAFVYSERERTRVMLYQLGPNRLNYAGSRQLWGFDAVDDIALKAIQDGCSTLFREGAVFVQFSCTGNGKHYITYVIDQEGKLTAFSQSLQNGSKRNVKKILKNLHDYFQRRETVRKRRHGYNEDAMNEDLEYLYDLLMRPIACHLENMKPEHQLILSPSEILTKVPFAALRDRDQPAHKKYLIERHTIAFTFSLRVLERCSERLQELKSMPPPASHGSIIALGNPEYGGYHKPLEGSGKEVMHIKSLFAGESEVVTLLKENATVEQLLYWAGEPSRESYRQAIIHIGAHGEVDEEDHMKSVIRLARPAHLAGDDSPTEETTSSKGKQLVTEQDEDEDDDTDDDEMDISDDAHGHQSSFMSPFIRRGTVMDNSFQNWEAGSSSGALPLESLRADWSSNQRNDPRYDLKAEDITDSEGIEWRAELVVLSACRTSQGKLSAEAVLSLARAFMIAGVPCVVASQWEVLDDATCDLMKCFYEHLRGGKDVATALRSSMLKMLQVDNCEVRKWAPFAVWGVPTLCIPSYLQQKASERSSSSATE